MTLGKQIRQARESKNLSQEELAEKLGVSRQAVSKWENDNSIPQGINRELMAQILGLEVLSVEEAESSINSQMKWRSRIGWGVSVCLATFLVLAIYVWNTEKSGMGDNNTLSENGDSIENTSDNVFVNGEEGIPAIKKITFYDEEQNEVESEALWYDGSKIDSILVQWQGGTPTSIKMFSIPSGSETMEMTELLMTKSVLDGDTAALLSAESLKAFQEHIYFELDFGKTVVVSEEYNIFNHEGIE